MNCLYKNGGWRGVGEFVRVRAEFILNGIRMQICSYDQQLDANGRERSREYYELRTKENVVNLPRSVRSVKAAISHVVTA